MSTNKLSHLKLQDDNGNDLPQEVQDRVNNFIDKFPTIPWFKPSKDLKKSDVEEQINFTLECFGVKASIEYKALKSEEDWASARDSAWDSAIDSAWDSALASARDSAMDSARDSAWDSAWDSAIDSAWDSAMDSARDSAWDSARASAWASAWASACASQEVLLEDNKQFKKSYPNGAFKQVFKLWEMGLYPVGILEGTGKFTVYVPEIDLDNWGNEEETLTNDGIPQQGAEVYIKTVGSDIWRKAKFIAFYEGKIVVDVGGLLWTKIWKLQPQKTELTLAEVEEKLGLDKGSLTIKV